MLKVYKTWTPEELITAKKAAARLAVLQLRSGLCVGLGTGSTVNELLPLIPALSLQDMTYICTSHETQKRALALGLNIVDFDQFILQSNNEKPIDITIDGADEVDKQLCLIKGGGGALLWEKLIAQSSKAVHIIVSADKMVQKLGQFFKLPVEVVFHGRFKALYSIQQIYKNASLRGENGHIFRTDGGNCIVDIPGFKDNPTLVQSQLKQITGVIETGLFLKEASFVYVGQPDGTCHCIKRHNDL